MSAAPAALLEGVSKSFGATRALDGLTLRVEAGEIHAVLGPNGAGKTTALDLLLGLRRADTGTVRLLGGDPRDAGVRRRVGATPQEVAFPPALRVREIVDLVRAHYPQPLGTREVLERFGLARLSERQAGGLSGGQRRRLGIALAFAGGPDAVFLDEPTAGLDVETRLSVWRELRSFAGGGRTVILTTHHLEEAEQLASSVSVIVSGRVVASGTVPELRRHSRLTRVRLRASGLAPPTTRRTEASGETTTYFVEDARRVVQWLVAEDVALDGLEISAATLEDAFVALTGETA